MESVLKRVLVSLFIVIAIRIVAPGDVRAEEDSGGMCGNISWQNYDAGGINILMSGCTQGGFSELLIKNPDDYPLCLHIVGERNNQSWHYPLAANGHLAPVVERITGENWRVGATINKDNGGCG